MSPENSTKFESELRGFGFFSMAAGQPEIQEAGLQHLYNWKYEYQTYIPLLMRYYTNIVIYTMSTGTSNMESDLSVCRLPSQKFLSQEQLKMLGKHQSFAGQELFELHGQP